MVNLQAVVYLETHRSYIKEFGEKIILVADKKDAKVYCKRDVLDIVEKLKEKEFINPKEIYV
jgi:hypothetical protein